MLSRQDVERQLKAFRELSLEEQGKETAAQLAFVARQNCAPCIIDRGCMLDGEGRYREEYARIFDAYLANEDLYLCLVHTRSPTYRNLPRARYFFERRLAPLATPDSQVLITRLLREAGIQLEADKVSHLAEATAGFPPAAYYIVSQVEDYGADVVLGDPARVADFHSRNFSRFLADLSLDASERELLRYLASETRLPLAGIAAALGLTVERAAKAVANLIDLSLLELHDAEYSVAAPIEAAVRREDGIHSRRWYEGAFGRLERVFWADEDSLPPISIVDATLRAALRIGMNKLAGYGTLVRPSVLVRAAEEKYHSQDYRAALDYAERARTMGGASPRLIEVELKSHAQLRDFGPAWRAFREYAEFRDRRQHYLQGFIERKAGNHGGAATAFQKGYARGDRSISLLRDYADSMLQLGDADTARRLALEALDRFGTNVFLRDLRARIEIADGTVADAEAALDELESVDRHEQFIFRRRASFLLHRRGNAEAVRSAIELAERAARGRGAPVGAQMLLAEALARGREWGRAAAVRGEIRKRKDCPRHAVERLECHEALEREDWRRAEQLLDRLEGDRSSKAMRAAMLKLKGGDPSALLSDRQAATSEAERLQEDLGSAGALSASQAESYE